jgi:hypothetical protein
VLLLVIDKMQNNEGFLTGKMFEYFGCKKPIFAIGPVSGNANELIKETDSGIMIDYNDNDGAYRLLKKYYTDWQNNSFEFKFDVDKYSRKNLTRTLAQILNEEM